VNAEELKARFRNFATASLRERIAR
jgi:hypothetical protein